MRCLDPDGDDPDGDRTAAGPAAEPWTTVPGAAHPPGTPGGYRPPTRLQRFLRARAPRCEWPGCGAAALGCDLDHDLAWPAGPTCACNLGPLCRHHHQAKQQLLRKTRNADSSLTWTSPTGRTWTSPVQHQPPQPVDRSPDLDPTRPAAHESSCCGDTDDLDALAWFTAHEDGSDQLIQDTDTEPADAEPADAEPADAEPADAEPADAEPADTDRLYDRILAGHRWGLALDDRTAGSRARRWSSRPADVGLRRCAATSEAIGAS